MIRQLVVLMAAWLLIPQLQAEGMRKCYRKKAFKRYRTKVQVVRGKIHSIKLLSLRSKQNITKDKLRQSVESKLPLIYRCYQRRNQQLMKARNRARFNTKRRRNVANKLVVRDNPNPARDPNSRHKLRVNLRLNAHGRAIKTSVTSKGLPRSIQDCFLWYLQGRKFYPPEGKRTALVRLLFEVGNRDGRSKPKKARRKRR